MTFTGSDYLLRLSALAVSFVGFSAVIVALRQALGAHLTDLHMLLVRLFIEGGLSVAAFGLLPTALSFTGLPESTIWRLSSAAAVLVFPAYLARIIRRHRRVIPRPFSLLMAFNLLTSVIALLALLMNAIGFGFSPGAAAYILALTWFLVVGGLVFVENLELFLRQSPPR